MDHAEATRSRSRAVAWFVLRCACLLALGASALLLADELGERPAVCGYDSSCEYLRQSPYGRILGLPLPALGVAGFLSVLVLTFAAPRLARVAAGVGGLAAVMLVVIQVVSYGRVCAYCLVVDGAAVVGAGAALLASGRAPIRRKAAWITAVVMALVVPYGFAAWKPPLEVPDVVRAAWAPDRLTVVEYTDFGCAFCRKTHATLGHALEGASALHVLRPVPVKRALAAQEAAVVYAALAGRGASPTALADALFTAVEHAGEGALDRAALAATTALEVRQIDAALADVASVVARLRAEARDAHVTAVPVVWIHDRIVLGRQTAARYRDVLERARTARGR